MSNVNGGAEELKVMIQELKGKLAVIEEENTKLKSRNNELESLVMTYCAANVGEGGGKS